MKNVIISILAIAGIIGVGYLAKTASEKPRIQQSIADEKTQSATTVFVCPAPPFIGSSVSRNYRTQLSLLHSDRITLRAINRFKLDQLLDLTHEQTKRYIERNLDIKLDEKANTISITVKSSSIANAQALNFAMTYSYIKLLDETNHSKVIEELSEPREETILADLKQQKSIYTAKLKSLNIQISEATPEQKADPKFSTEKQKEFETYMAEYEKIAAEIEKLTGEKPDEQNDEIESQEDTYKEKQKHSLEYIKKGWVPAVEKLLLSRFNESK